MANSEAGTSSDTAQALGGEYQVFLNFSGDDTRHGFTDFLHDGLIKAGVRVFRDKDELQEGEVIGDNLLHAIDNSILYIPIFSQNYASSKWCLRELAHIVKNVFESEGKKSILPIFFHVEPEDVKLKTPPDSATLLEHEMKCPNEVKEWRKALEVVDKTKGWIVKKKQSQAEIVNLVVQTVLKKLEIKQFMTENLIGLDEQEQELIKLLDVNHCDVRLIGIYGMGGIGKTTVAKVIFDRFLSHFGYCCSFLEDIRVNSSTKEGIVELQKKLLSDIGSGSVEQLKNSEHGMRRIRDILNTKKVLVVLDDVDSKEHFKKLIGNSLLHSGSRIIITTRNIDILQVEGFEGQIFPYEMPKMDDGPALQLFCRHAFHQDFPLDDYCGLSSKIVSGLGGLPLAIEVIGSLLYRKGQEIWVETLEKLREVPEKKIVEKLRISYDDLDNNHKDIFLDIACFLYNGNKTDSIYMWTVCKFFPIEGIDVLTSKCLVKILDNDKFWMHDQLIALGRQIVREESRYYLGKQSRLWDAQDALQIIGTEETKRKVQALEISTYGSPIEIRNEDFERLPNLRFLNLKRGTYVGDFAKCHSNLRWFSWSNPSSWEDHGMNKVNLDFRASNLYLDKLVVCKLHGLDFKDDSKAWDSIKRAENLKVLSITRCSGVTTIPNISRCSALERLTLVRCSSLKRIESFIGDLRSLIELKIIDCSNLTDLPKEVGALVKLNCFSLQHCKRLRELPDSLGNLTSLTELDLSGTMIMELPNFILQLKSLEILRFPLWQFNVKKYYDWQLTCGISTLVNLREPDLSRRNRMKCEILIENEELSYLEIPNLEYTLYGGIPRTINTFHDLHILDFTNCHDCHEIQELLQLPTSLTYLHLRPTSLLREPILSKLTNLVNLLLRDGSDYEGKSKLIPRCDLRGIVNLSRLKWVELRLLNVPANPQLTYSSRPQEIVLGHLDSKPPVQLPSSEWRWRNLSTLEICFCKVENISLDGLSRLENLRVFKCERFRGLSIPLELRKLRQVTVESCRDLVEIQVVDVSKSLEGLTVADCKSLTIISGLSYLKNLERLEIECCDVLTNVEGLNELESMKALSVCYCSSFKWLIDASCTKIPDDCIVHILRCGYFIKDSIKNRKRRMLLKHYKKEILHNTSKKDSFTIRFHLGVKKPSEVLFGSVRGIEREKEGVDPDSVTYEGLIADVKSFGFHFKRMWYETKDTCKMQMEIKRDGIVNKMLDWASRQGFIIDLYVEGGVNSEWEGEYGEEMMKMSREERRMKTDVYSNEDGAKGDVSCPNEDSNSAPVGGESETHGNSSVDDFELGWGNAKCFEATTSIAEEDLDNVKKQVELHEKPRDEETITLEHYGEEIFLNTLNKVLNRARGREMMIMHNHATIKNSTWNSTCGPHIRSRIQVLHRARGGKRMIKHAQTTAWNSNWNSTRGPRLRSRVQVLHRARGRERMMMHTHKSTKSSTWNSTCGRQSSPLQHRTRRTGTQAAKIQSPVEAAALPVEAVGHQEKRKRMTASKSIL